MNHPFPDDNAATNWALQWLASRGFAISRPNSTARMTCKELRDRHAPHLGLPAFHQRLNHPACPVFAAERGPTGRILSIAPTPVLIKFLSMSKLPGRDMSLRREAA